MVGGSEGDGSTAVSAGIGDGGGMVGVGEGAADGFVTVGAGGGGGRAGEVRVGGAAGALVDVGAGGGAALGGSEMITVADARTMHSSYHFGLPRLAHVPVSKPPGRGLPSWTV